MTDALSRLKTALSDRYTIERELGRGGMATVYLAEDQKHHRKVAVKVLRPELAAALGAERFHQEIEIAARLHHPHILPLYDSGDTDGFLYYIMPFEEGQSLRDKLAKEGELPITEAVRILRDVVDALAHAHKHNVVHRDIKPDNVMLSERHALVTDFGVAKAVCEATGRQQLTTEGVALGTPTYMAPEQAAADPHIDHRADIYAVGAVAYELLTGRPPFLGTTPQMILSAHMTDSPEPVSKYRESVPPALEQLVLKCLEKKAADRWQTADELLPQLETLATPSGGMTPTATLPVGSPKTGWKVTATIGSVAVVIAVVIAAWLGSTGEEGPPRLAVLPFENRGDAEDEFLADGIAEEISGRLAKLSGLEVIATTSAARYKSTEKTASQIADELDVEFLLVGTLRWTRSESGDSRVRVRPQLIRAANTTQEWTDTFDGVLSDVFALQVDIAEQVAVALHVTLLVAEQEAVRELPTDNVEAYEQYLRGNDYYRFGELEAGSNVLLQERMYQRAVELDPKFALAWAQLGRTHAMIYFVGQDGTSERLAEAKGAIDKAFDISPGLTQAHLSMGWYFYWGFRDYDKSLEHFEVVLGREPNNSQALVALASIQRRQGRSHEAVTTYERALSIDPLQISAITSAGLSHADLGEYSEAARLYDRALELEPGRLQTYAWKMELHARRFEVDSAARLYQQVANIFGEARAVQRFTAFTSVLYQVEEYTEALLRQPGNYSEKATTLRRLGNSRLEAVYWDSTIVAGKENSVRGRDSWRIRASLAAAHAALGDSATAMAEIERAGSFGVVSKDWIVASIFALRKAEMFLMLGRFDDAVEQLGLALRSFAVISPRQIQADPFWAPLRSNPRFQALLEQYGT